MSAPTGGFSLTCATSVNRTSEISQATDINQPTGISEAP